MKKEMSNLLFKLNLVKYPSLCYFKLIRKKEWPYTSGFLFEYKQCRRAIFYSLPGAKSTLICPFIDSIHGILNSEHNQIISSIVSLVSFLCF